jgi:hypothetical protein
MNTLYYFFSCLAACCAMYTAITAPLPITDDYYQRRTHLNKVRP